MPLICNKCQKETEKYPDGRCRPCHRAYLKEWNKGRPKTEKRKRSEKIYNTIHRQKRKKELVEMLGGKCEECGFMGPAPCFDFAHRDPKEKLANIGALLSRSMTTILPELEKCRLLCANCHRFETFKKGHGRSAYYKKQFLQHTPLNSASPLKSTP